MIRNNAIYPVCNETNQTRFSYRVVLIFTGLPTAWYYTLTTLTVLPGRHSDGIEVLGGDEPCPTMIISDLQQEQKEVVKQIRNSLGSTPDPFDHVVLSAHGSAASMLRVNISEEDDIVKISQKITHSTDECNTTISSPDWTKTYASTTG
jgi:hypothetical protein